MAREGPGIPNVPWCLGRVIVVGPHVDQVVDITKFPVVSCTRGFSFLLTRPRERQDQPPRLSHLQTHGMHQVGWLGGGS
jgi:hypothetical protein